MLNMVILKNFSRKTLEGLTGLSAVFRTQPTCCTYIPDPITHALPSHWGSTHSHIAMIGSIQNGIDQSAAKMANSESALRRRVGCKINSLRRWTTYRHGQCAST